MTASFVFSQSDGNVTLAYYAHLNSLGPAGQIATALFRAQKRSSAAKSYRRARFRRAAYDVKSWSLSEVVRLTLQFGLPLNISCGWLQDPAVHFGQDPSWVLYVDLPFFGQVSFHSPSRGIGPDYPRSWDGFHLSQQRILNFCDSLTANTTSTTESTLSTPLSFPKLPL